MKRISLLFAILLSLTSCVFAPKFVGPKFDSSRGRLAVDPNVEVIVALTNAKLDRSNRKGFDAESRQIFENLKTYEGFMGGTVKVEIFGENVWTMTVWENEKALEKFVNSARHLNAVYMTNQAMKKFRHLHISVPARGLPYSWHEAEKILDAKEFQDHKPF